MFEWLMKVWAAICEFLFGPGEEPVAPAAAPKKAAKRAATKVKCPRCGKSVTQKTFKRAHGAKCKG